MFLVTTLRVVLSWILPEKWKELDTGSRAIESWLYNREWYELTRDPSSGSGSAVISGWYELEKRRSISSWDLLSSPAFWHQSRSRQSAIAGSVVRASPLFVYSTPQYSTDIDSRVRKDTHSGGNFLLWSDSSGGGVFITGSSWKLLLSWCLWKLSRSTESATLLGIKGKMKT